MNAVLFPPVFASVHKTASSLSYVSLRLGETCHLSGKGKEKRNGNDEKNDSYSKAQKLKCMLVLK